MANYCWGVCTQICTLNQQPSQCWPCCFQNDIFIIFSHFPPASYCFKSQITLSSSALGINLDKNKFCNYPLAFMWWALRPCKVKSYKGLQGIHHMPWINIKVEKMNSWKLDLPTLESLGVVGLQSKARLDLGLENKKWIFSDFFAQKYFSRQIQRT